MELAKQNQIQYEYFELPLVASTSMDWFLSNEWSNKALQARRSEIRQMLGLNAPSPLFEKHSLGRYGSFQLEPSSVLMCLLTDVRLRGNYVDQVGHTFAACGLPALMQSDTLLAMSEMVVQSVRALVMKRHTKKSVVNSINEVIYGLSNQNTLFHNAARDYSRIVRAVTDVLPNVQRSTGHLVRIDGPDALIVVRGPEREELRTVESEYLTSFGIKDEDQPFVQIEQRWSPDSALTYYQPAIAVSDKDPDKVARLESLLHKHESVAPRD